MINNSYVYINEIKDSKYPNKEDFFNPSVLYPEYKFDNEISKSPNYIYEMIRQCLYNMGFDKDNFGCKEWNPLKEIIKPGDIVLLKPNMVMHENKNKENGIECLITHPSLVRAMIDYIILALNGVGTIIVGDAPMQSCDFEKLIEDQGYIDIIEFYKNKGIEIELVDFRNYKTASKNGLLKQVKNEISNEAIIVDLKNKSEFANIDKDRFDKLRITNYDKSSMYKHHNSKKNEYSIAKKILEADVIINMPKPKTHRKAGVTISLKNLVGINTNKEWLPHHTNGSKEEGGDEYLKKSFIKKKRTYLIEKRDEYMIKNMKRKAKLYGYMALTLSIFNKILNVDRYSEGSWFGNDTIWRTILDLNKIIFYSGKDGVMMKTKQRNMLIVADMIVSGEGEGPLLPSSKKVGMIAMGTNPVVFDEVISTIMGFKYFLIPSIKNSRKIKYYPLIGKDQTIIKSNNNIYNLKKLEEIKYENSLKFMPSMGWHKYDDTKRT